MAEENNPRSNDPAGEQGDAAGAEQSAARETAEGSEENLAARLDEALEQVEAFRDQALRAQADAENARRRAARDVENAHKFALEKFTADLLPVIDSMEKAVEAASEASGAESIAEGVELSLKLFLSVLEKHGIERIDPAGEPFDPQVHEAMTMMPSSEAEPNSVVEVMQAGYLLNGRVVRAAKVVVAKAPDA
ncbi:MAG: nucleotide exchange factor GrpE [Pseudomonadota bacterium]